MPEKSPFDIAKETLKLLSSRKLLPTPENYQALYHEVSGVRHVPHYPDEQLKAIARALPAQTATQQKLLAQLNTAIAQRSWVGVQAALVGLANLPLVTTPAHLPDRPVVTQEVLAGLCEQIARLIENTLPMIGADDERLRQQAQELLEQARHPDPNATQLRQLLGNFSFRMSFATEDQLAIKTSLLALLQLIFKNIGALVVEDQWLSGQIDTLVSATTPPLTLRHLDDVQARLKDVIFKQTEAKARSIEAQTQMKQLLGAFIDRLAQMTEHSGAYQDQIEHCARLLEDATTLSDIAPVLQEAIQATRSMTGETQGMRDELRAMRERTEQANANLQNLQQELDRVSTQARHDPLTGALNRKGLDESIAREMARMNRQHSALCVALLDLDDFKKLNDEMGHDTGDAALVHLAEVARASLRPQDQLARYGGEEFIVILPDTDVAAGVAIMKRLQRALTTRYFMNDERHVLITFSAGVAQLAEGESQQDAIRRADQAMYLAKRAGKNRVLAA